MKLQKQHIVLRGEWEDNEFIGHFELEPEPDGFWCEAKIRAEYYKEEVCNIQFDTWESGYIDEENNECTLSDSMDELLESKVKDYLTDTLTSI